jgi:hypothetical protein
MQAKGIPDVPTYVPTYLCTYLPDVPTYLCTVHI